ncbi:MAG TPA: asparagine synthase-related protein [Desulfomonilia bacterium]
MKYHSCIADTGKYLIKDDSGRISLYEYFGDAVKAAGKSSKVKLNITALTEVPSHYAFVGDKTIINNISRTQWFSNYDPEHGFFENEFSLRHGNREANAGEIARELHLALREEISDYIKNSSRVGILLSGGMDSRIVSSILKEIQNERKSFDVYAFCWGNPETRDPVYAKRIAGLYGWDYQHFQITSDTLKENIEVCADEGCFYAPKHLHALPDVTKRVSELGIECLLAGSYGDSIGRAEYSGVRVENLTPIRKCFRNWFRLFNQDLYEEYRKRTISDISAYHSLFGESSEAAINELDYQLHYMRNMLGTCMNILNRVTDFHQVFTRNDIVSLMWSFANKCRTNEVYKYLLGEVDPKLLDIPWARTGMKYLDDSSNPDDLPKSFHNYSEWVRNELFSHIRGLIFNGEIEKTGIFNMDQIHFIMMQNRKSKILNGRIEEIILWLSSLSIFLRNNDWEIDCDNPRSPEFSLAGRFETILYLWSHRLRNIKIR